MAGLVPTEFDEEDARRGPVGGAGDDEGGDAAAHLIARLGLVDDGLFHGVEQAFALAVEEGGECLFLAGEDGVEGALAGPRLLHHAVDAGVVVAALGEAVGDGVEKARLVPLVEHLPA